MVVVALATTGGLALGSGAWAERLAALSHPSLQELLGERDRHGGGEHAAPPRQQLRDRYESLRQRRLRIEDELAPAVRPGLWRRPALPSPPLDVPIGRPARAVDLDPAGPDGVLRGARP